jgi:His-Xaa-Ser system radical SAM maturase HxsC
MIRLSLPITAEATMPFVALLTEANDGTVSSISARLIEADHDGLIFASEHGLFEVEGVSKEDILGEVVLVQPRAKRMERLFRLNANSNTLLVTERCDQLCVMCSQPPKKTHEDRFSLLTQASLHAPFGACIGISGGEPTLYKEQLFSMLEEVLRQRSDVSFHVLTNGQHFEQADIPRMRDPLYRRVSFGIPLYASTSQLHDQIVGKSDALVRLRESLAYLAQAGARIELRTVLVKSNQTELPHLARFISNMLRFIEVWSIMQLENVGFAKGRWHDLYVDHAQSFEGIDAALDIALTHGVPVQLFNFARCTVPSTYRMLARASISDWKRKYVNTCQSCTQQSDCAGFFEWHPTELAEQSVTPL